jgi:carbon monoxide dehydrogenase subunit G
MMGMEITERLVRKDDDARQLVYGIVSGAPVEHHEATITVHPDGDGSRVTWAVDTDDAMTEMMGQIYQGGLVALKEHAEK